MIIVGIDPASTRLAMVAHVPGQPSYIAQTMVGLSGKKTAPWSPAACDRAARVTNEFLKVVRGKWPNSEIHAFLESPLVGKGGVRSTMVQAFTSGAVQGALIGAGCTVTMVNVGTWKKAVIGNGHATKDDVAEALRLRWPALFKGAGGDKDLHDAAAIAIWGENNIPDRGMELPSSLCRLYPCDVLPLMRDAVLPQRGHMVRYRQPGQTRQGDLCRVPSVGPLPNVGAGL